MSYLIQEPTTFFNIKLSDEGRRLLSLGQLTFDKVALSDREINYGIDRVMGYNICNNRVLAPMDDQASFEGNYDGSVAADLVGYQVGSSKQIISARTDWYGFFSGDTDNFYIDGDKWLGFSQISYSATSIDGGNSITFSGGTYDPQAGDLLYIPWEPIQNSGKTYYNSAHEIYSANPTVGLWYRVLNSTSGASLGTSTVTIDRGLPNFGGTVANSTQYTNAYVYPFNGIETYYGSATTIETKVWNMNIVRTSSEIGTSSSISGYTTYGSIEYNGTKHYLGFSAETRAIGIIHYTTEYTGNTFAEQFTEKSVVVNIPNVMWHKTTANVGEGLLWGITLYDQYGSTIFDEVAQTTYRNLRDGIASTSNIIGRVYHKLQLIVITDPELLTALTYKSNRNYTLPQLNLTLSSAPKYPLSTSNTSGFTKADKQYFVTYVVSSNAYMSGTSFGYPQPLHCGYISQIDGEVDSAGNQQYLTASFPANSFPFLRGDSQIGNTSSAFSGTGWSANKVQLLVNEATSATTNFIDIIDSSTWKLISTESGNGIYTGDTTDTSIDPLKLSAYQFIISQEDYNSGTTYSLNGLYSGATANSNINNSGMTFGSESFFYGSIKATIMATTFKSIITVYAKNNEYNSTLNKSFDSDLDSNVYITEVGVFNENNVLVASGKPSRPITKNDSRFLAFQLEIDF